MKKILMLTFLCVPTTYAMETIKVQGHRSPRMPVVFAHSYPAPTPSNSPKSSSVSVVRPPSYSAGAGAYSFSEATQRVVVSDGSVPESVLHPQLETDDQQVKKECTKFKLALLAGSSALVSAGITAVVTYFNSRCN